MSIQSINHWNLLEGPAADKGRDYRQIKDAVPELKEKTIKTDSAEFSKEGMQALRERVQNMPGHMDVEEIMRMKEILPKLKMNPADEFYWAMKEDMQNSLNAVKESKGTYTLDDLIAVRMEAYEKQYDSLQQAYRDGSREIYVCDGMDENGRMQYHQVTKEEDEAYLKEAFGRAADSLMFAAKSQEIQWQINEKFGKQSALPVSLPEGYGEKLSGILKRAADSYIQQKETGTHVTAAGLALQFLNADKKFSDAMHVLFSNLKPAIR